MATALELLRKERDRREGIVEEAPPSNLPGEERTEQKIRERTDLFDEGIRQVKELWKERSTNFPNNQVRALFSPKERLKEAGAGLNLGLGVLQRGFAGVSNPIIASMQDKKGGEVVGSIGQALTGERITTPADIVRMQLPETIQPPGGKIGDFIDKNTQNFPDAPIRKWFVDEGLPADAVAETIGFVGEVAVGASLAKVFQGLKMLKPTGNLDNFFINQNRLGKRVIKSFKNAINNKFSQARSPFYEVTLRGDDFVDDISRKLMDQGVSKEAAEEALEVVARSKPNNIQDAYKVYDHLIDDTNITTLRGGTTKGGLENVSRVRKKASGIVKDEIKKTLYLNAEKNPKTLRAVNDLMQLEDEAAKIYYPHLNNMTQQFGGGNALKGSTSGVFTSQSQFPTRLAIKETPKIAKDFKKYFRGKYKKDLKEFIRDSKSLSANLQGFQLRHGINKALKSDLTRNILIGTGLGGTGIGAYLGLKNSASSNSGSIKDPNE